MYDSFKTKYVLLVLFLLCGSSSYCQSPSFRMEANPSKVTIGEPFELKIIFENIEPSKLILPNIEPFDIIGGPQILSRSTSINGVESSSVTYIYQLRSEKGGKFTINPVTTTLGGKKLISNSMVIEVSKDTPTKKIESGTNDKSIIFHVEPTNASVYVGEQVLFESNLYYSEPLEAVQLEELLYFEGCYVAEQESINQKGNIQKINGKAYNSYKISRDYVFPQRTGDIQVTPSSMLVSVEDKTAAPSFFFNPSKKVKVRSNSPRIKVKPLPKGAPQAFSGCVGSFSIQARVDQMKVRQGEPIELSLTIKGDGDPNSILPPKIELPTHADLYDPSLVSESTVKENDKLITSKKYTYIIIPNKDTTLIINPEFVYFSPINEKYEIATISPFHVFVIKAEDDSKNNEDGPFLDLSSNNKFITKEDVWHWSRALIIMCIMIGLFIVNVLIHIYKLRQNKKENFEKNTPEKVSLSELEAAKKHLDDNNISAFYDTIYKSIHNYLAHKMNLNYVDIDVANVTDFLKSKGISSEFIETYTAIYNQCELARFAGIPKGQKDVYEKSIQLLKELHHRL